MENSMEASQKLKILLLYDPAILFLRMYLKECKSGYKKATCNKPMFIAAFFTIVNLWKQPRCLTADELIKKM
jgi:hypothetical protein